MAEGAYGASIALIIVLFILLSSMEQLDVKRFQ
ncbi:YjcZ family sporulation protein [Neobacillus drentensis]